MTNGNKSGFAAVALFAALHFLCGIPLLLAVLGIVGFIWYLKRWCATCPRNEGRCRVEEGRVRE